MLDVVILTNYILGNDIPTPEQYDSGDINGDQILNVLDVVILVNNILN